MASTCGPAPLTHIVMVTFSAGASASAVVSAAGASAAGGAVCPQAAIDSVRIRTRSNAVIFFILNPFLKFRCILWL